MRLAVLLEPMNGEVKRLLRAHIAAGMALALGAARLIADRMDVPTRQPLCAIAPGSARALAREGSLIAVAITQSALPI